MDSVNEPSRFRQVQRAAVVLQETFRIALDTLLGGVIGGYCASGRLNIATRPATTITIDSTDAKIGCSAGIESGMPGTPATVTSSAKFQGKARSQNASWIPIAAFVSERARGPTSR